jgi:hypothetical protein
MCCPLGGDEIYQSSVNSPTTFQVHVAHTHTFLQDNASAAASAFDVAPSSSLKTANVDPEKGLPSEGPVLFTDTGERAAGVTEAWETVSKWRDFIGDKVIEKGIKMHAALSNSTSPGAKVFLTFKADEIEKATAFDWAPFPKPDCLGSGSVTDKPKPVAAYLPWVIAMRRLSVRCGSLDLPFSGHPAICQNVQDQTEVFIIVVDMIGMEIKKLSDALQTSQDEDAMKEGVLHWIKLKPKDACFIPAGMIPIALTLNDAASLLWVPLVSKASMEKLPHQIRRTILADNFQSMELVQSESPWKYFITSFRDVVIGAIPDFFKKKALCV